MVVGTSSHVGKSLLVTVLCRILARKGYRVSPFKAQNMSLNAYVTETGAEIAYAQAVQSWAAGQVPQVEMNPILLKPQGNMTSQVILQGQAVGVYRAQDYYETVFTPGWQAVTDSLDHLTTTYDWVICEGAGSPAEVNLRHRDLTNMRVASYLQSPTWLVADIDRGGALAHVVGTLQLLLPSERDRVQGIVINKFRGLRELLQPGLDWLEDYTGVPVVGVLPWLDLQLPQEDSLSLLDPPRSRGSGDLEIAVVHLPRIANFTDFDPLRAEASVRLRYLKPGEPLGTPDAVILPGTKSTLPDLLVLQNTGLAGQLQSFPGSIVGICGGLQMLGTAVHDPEGLEGYQGTLMGLGLLPAETTLTPRKVTRQIETTIRWPQTTRVRGYEIHQGDSQVKGAEFNLFTDSNLGFWDPQEQGRVWGSYLHGLFDNHRFRRLWLNQLRQRKGLDPLPLLEGHYSEDRERLFEDMANRCEPHLQLERLGIP